MMAALQRRIGERGEDSQDNLTRFYTTSLRYLTTTSGKKVDVTPWTITSFDVEFGPQIGAGGLCVLCLYMLRRRELIFLLGFLVARFIA